MEFKYIELDKVEYSKLNEIEYEKRFQKKEVINFLADFTFKIYESSPVDYPVLLDEDIESIYSKILTFIKDSDYRVPKTINEKKHSEKILKLAEEYKQQNTDTLSGADLTKVDAKISDYTTKPLLQILNFRAYTEYGTVFLKTGIGYQVFLEFKRKFLNKQNAPKRPVTKNRSADINYKFALLQEMGVIRWLETNILTNNDDRAEILQEIMGGSTETLKDYLKGKTIHKDVRQKAMDFINEKRLPK